MVLAITKPVALGRIGWMVPLRVPLGSARVAVAVMEPEILAGRVTNPVALGRMISTVPDLVPDGLASVKVMPTEPEMIVRVTNSVTLGSTG